MNCRGNPKIKMETAFLILIGRHRIKEIDQNVKQLEQEHCFNELDFATTESEIAKTIAQFKINKSPGIDFISNSMYDNKFYITNSVMFFKICQCLS